MKTVVLTMIIILSSVTFSGCAVRLTPEHSLHHSYTKMFVHNETQKYPKTPKVKTSYYQPTLKHTSVNNKITYNNVYHTVNVTNKQNMHVTNVQKTKQYKHTIKKKEEKRNKPAMKAKRKEQHRPVIKNRETESSNVEHDEGDRHDKKAKKSKRKSAKQKEKNS